MKRAFDIVFSTIGLIASLPLFLVLSVIIKAESGGPVFFVQERVGKGFKPFDLYKFRTMVAGAPGLGPKVTARADPRITRVGGFLRKTKLDELPQLFNVLKGDMSFVGPRPEMPEYVEAFRKDYEEILAVKPGITDYAAIEFSDEESVLKRFQYPEEGYINEVLPAKIDLYRKYIREQSFINDIRLIFKTLAKMVK